VEKSNSEAAVVVLQGESCIGMLKSILEICSNQHTHLGFVDLFPELSDPFRSKLPILKVALFLLSIALHILDLINVFLRKIVKNRKFSKYWKFPISTWQIFSLQRLQVIIHQSITMRIDAVFCNTLNFCTCIW